MGNWLLTVQKAHGFLAPEMMEGQCPYGFGKAAPYPLVLGGSSRLLLIFASHNMPISRLLWEHRTQTKMAAGQLVEVWQQDRLSLPTVCGNGPLY